MFVKRIHGRLSSYYTFCTYSINKNKYSIHVNHLIVIVSPRVRTFCNHNTISFIRASVFLSSFHHERNVKLYALTLSYKQLLHLSYPDLYLGCFRVLQKDKEPKHCFNYGYGSFIHYDKDTHLFANPHYIIIHRSPGCPCLGL